MTLTLVYLAAALLITRLPFLRSYFSLFNTLIPDIIQRLLIKGKTSPSGEKVISPLKQGIIKYIGYTMTSVLAIMLFYSVAKGSYSIILLMLIGLIVLALLLSVRSFIAFIWALSFVVLLAGPLYYKHEAAIMHLSIFLSSMILVQLINNALRELSRSLKKNPEKTAPLAMFKRVPAVIFGVVVLGQSLFAGYFIVSSLLNLQVAVIRFDIVKTLQGVEQLFS
ncbi:M50 family metallopeptidase [Neobacillus sp. K501]